MMKLAHRLLTLNKNLPRFLLSTNSKPTENPQDPSSSPSSSTEPNPSDKPSPSPSESASQPKASLNRDRDSDFDDDDQPKYQRQDRTTLMWTLYRIFFWGSTAVLGYNIYLVSQHNKKTPVEDEVGALPGFITAAKYITEKADEITEFFTKPPLDKLMPDVIHPDLQHKTLVLNLTGTLLETEYVFGKGLIVNKRPGLQQFLNRMANHYQIVIFSDDDMFLLSTLIPSLDPRRQMIAASFGRQCMVFSRGHYIKDLKYLNRDLRRVVVVDKNKSIVQKQKQNVICLSEYNGNQQDRELQRLAKVLQSLARPDVGDVRKILEKMGDNPLQWMENQIKERQDKINKAQSNKVFGFFNRKSQ